MMTDQNEELDLMEFALSPEDFTSIGYVLLRHLEAVKVNTSGPTAYEKRIAKLCEIMQKASEGGFSGILIAKEPTCNWRNEFDDVWMGTCGIAWQFLDGATPADNEMEFCPQCGRKLDYERTGAETEPE